MIREGLSALEEPPKFPDKTEKEPRSDVAQAAEAFLTYGQGPKDGPETLPETPEKNSELEKLKSEIIGAADINNLCDILDAAETLGPNNANIETVVQNIRDIEEFLNDHMIEIVMGVIDKGNEKAAHYRNQLGQRLKMIIEDDLAIRSKVKELLKAKMDESFRENKGNYVKGAIAESKSFDQLYGVIKQFKGVNIKEEYGKKYTPDQAIEVIMFARHNFEKILNEPELLKKLDADVNKNIDEFIENVPQDSGIKKRVKLLLIEKFEQTQRDSNSRDSQEKPGSKFWGGFRKYFKRKKR